ncbi:hypothetical protein NDA01_29675 [Trichocoleus desertorum AS-A10]|uniref:hypothetical protein n=1 Tax=Trichocoleus desertorum TaxID=1481672 RepID=UPI003299BE31
MPAQHSQRPLTQAIEQAIANPAAANLKALLKELECILPSLPKAEQLQVAGDVLAQLIDLYVCRAEQLLDAWEEQYNSSSCEPILSTDLLQEVLRHTMTLNLDEIWVAAAPKPQPPQPTDTVVGLVAPTNLLEFLNQIHPEQGQQSALDVAHEEDITTWVQAIAQWMQQHPQPQVSLLELQRSLQMPLIQIWLALLLGGFALEQRGNFYQLDSIWVSAS